MLKELKAASLGCLHNKKNSINPCLKKEESKKHCNIISKGFSENMCLVKRGGIDHKRTSQPATPKSLESHIWKTTVETEE